MGIGIYLSIVVEYPFFLAFDIFWAIHSILELYFPISLLDWKTACPFSLF